MYFLSVLHPPPFPKYYFFPSYGPGYFRASLLEASNSSQRAIVIGPLPNNRGYNTRLVESLGKRKGFTKAVKIEMYGVSKDVCWARTY